MFISYLGQGGFELSTIVNTRLFSSRETVLVDANVQGQLTRQNNFDVSLNANASVNVHVSLLTLHDSCTSYTDN